MDSLTAGNNFREALGKFVEFTDEEWELFKLHFKYRSLQKKDFFAEEGKVCDEMGFVAKGSLRYFHVCNGEDVTRYFSFENELASAYKSFITGEPNTNYIQALEDSLLIIIKRKAWDQLLNDPRTAYKMERLGRLIAEYCICCYEDRVTAFITQSPEERYLKLMETGKEILLRIPQHYIARFLGITPVSLSRIRKRVLTNFE